MGFIENLRKRYGTDDIGPTEGERKAHGKGRNELELLEGQEKADILGLLEAGDGDSVVVDAAIRRYNQMTDAGVTSEKELLEHMYSGDD